MNGDVDVLIIGGGPAGLAAGIVCARHGLQTMICEKRPLPTDKVCGEGVMPTGRAYLEHLGVTLYLSSDQYFPFDGISYFSQSGKMASAEFREGPGWGIPRLELSVALLRRASELSCLEIRSNVHPVPIHMDVEQSGRVYAQVGKDSVRSRLLIGADGLNSAVRRWACLDGPKGTHQRWGARQHFRGKPWNNKVEIHWGAGMEAYVTPCGSDLVGVAFLWDRQRHPHIAGGNKLIPALLQNFPALASHLEQTHAVDQPLAVGPMERKAVRPATDGVLLIGDAAGYLDALTGEGISLALAQAIALEKTIVPFLLSALPTHLLTRHDMAAYEQAYRAIVRSYYRMTHLVLWLSRHPISAEQMIALLGRWPALFQYLLSANMGFVSLLETSSRKKI